jgi:FHS family L-fucose permease-like MFS transporter
MQDNVKLRAADSQKKLLALMMAMFFAFGFCTVLVDTLIPKLKAMFALSYAEVMLTQFCFFGAYLLASAPAGWLLTRIGYLRGITVGLLVMAAGALMFTPAAHYGTYPGFLAALFILACGVTIVQAAANPLTAQLGDRAQAPSRLTLAQAFNSLATMIGPIVGSSLILAHVATFPDAAKTPPALLAALRQREAQVFQAPFLSIAAVLLGLAALAWSVRRWAPSPEAAQRGSYRRVLSNSRLVLGAVSIFTYVGAEVSIGSSIANYLMQHDVLGLAALQAGRLVSIYWGLAMVGRFCGTAILRLVPAGLVLAACAACAGALAILSAGTTGLVAAISVLAIGLFNSIMFPTIFTLAIETSGEAEAEASGILCMAIVGGAVVPLLTGVAADNLGLAHALLVPALCYAWILYYGYSVHRQTIRGPSSDVGPGLRDLASRN